MSDRAENACFGNILVVDDATANLQFLSNFLKAQGYTAFPASDGELALEFARATPPDLILLDIRMPGMDGFEVCRRLKADERTRDIPVIFISILEDEPDKVKGFQAGAVDYVTKPFQAEEVLARIATHLRLKELTDRLEQTVTARTSELNTANKQLQTELAERRRAELAAEARFRMLDATSASGVHLDDALRLMLDEIEAQTESVIGFYHFVKPDQETLSLQNWSTRTLSTICTAEGKGSHYSISEAGVWVDCVRERRPVIHNDYKALPHRKGMPTGHAQVVRELMLPVMRGDLIVAIIGVGNKPTDYDESDVQTISQLGDFSWEIVMRKRAEEELRALNLKLETRVRERTAELEEKNAELIRMNKAFVGRELKMVELKERIKELEKENRNAGEAG